MGNIRQKDFDYLLHKIASLLKIKKDLSTVITFISPFRNDTLQEGKELNKLADCYKLKFEWNITEQTTDRFNLRTALVDIIADLRYIYLTGELPVFDKLLVIPGVIIIGFMKNIWFSWNLMDVDMKIDEIKEKIILTPFTRKIDQFFGKVEVHKAISCYLSDTVNIEGFMIGAEHSYL